MKNTWIFLLGGAALLIGIADMPYGYYQLLRWLTCGVGGYGAYLAYNNGKIKWAWTMGIIALLFNPLAKFYFDKSIWKTLDLVAGCTYIFFCIAIKKIPNKDKKGDNK